MQGQHDRSRTFTEAMEKDLHDIWIVGGCDKNVKIPNCIKVVFEVRLSIRVHQVVPDANQIFSSRSHTHRVYCIFNNYQNKRKTTRKKESSESWKCLWPIKSEGEQHKTFSILLLILFYCNQMLPLKPPHWLSCKASVLRVADLVQFLLSLWSFFQVESYQWLKNWYSSGYPARYLAS